jgi:hypothetical protein
MGRESFVPFFFLLLPTPLETQNEIPLPFLLIWQRSSARLFIGRIDGVSGLHVPSAMASMIEINGLLPAIFIDQAALAI